MMRARVANSQRKKYRGNEAGLPCRGSRTVQRRATVFVFGDEVGEWFERFSRSLAPAFHSVRPRSQNDVRPQFGIRHQYDSVVDE